MKKIICLLMFAFLVASISASVNTEININSQFTSREKIEFSYTFLSDRTQEIRFMPWIKCPSAPLPLLQEETIVLKSNQPLTKTYSHMIVTEDIEPQTCVAYIKILEPTQQTFSKEFKIKTDPSFSLEPILENKIFLVGEKINLDYDADVRSVSTSATLIFPNEQKQKINLPYSFTAQQVGTYILEIIGSKKDYKTSSKKIQFSVLQNEVDFNQIQKGDLSQEEFNIEVQNMKQENEKKDFFSSIWSRMTGKVIDLF